MDKGLALFSDAVPGSEAGLCPLRLYVEVYNAKPHQTL